MPDAPLQNLDLTRSDEDDFSPDQLRTTFERFYATVVFSLTSFVNHIARLRSWKEPRRTAVFCAVFSISPGFMQFSLLTEDLITKGVCFSLAFGLPHAYIVRCSDCLGHIPTWPADLVSSSADCASPSRYRRRSKAQSWGSGLA